MYFFFLSAVNNNPTTPPSFSRKIKVLGFILGCCCLVAIIVNFINLHSDYEELHEFYIGYMGRKMLIQERRLTSRSYLNLLRREHQLNIEVSTYLNQTEPCRIFVLQLGLLTNYIDSNGRVSYIDVPKGVLGGQPLPET